MNLIINYDFFNAIRDVNENFSGFKIVRNNQKKWVKYNLPIFTILDYMFIGNHPKEILMALLLQANFSFTLAVFENLFNGKDIYKEIGQQRLRLLVSLLERINVTTTYDLLLKSECIDKTTNLKLNENKIPQIIESKYIIVPSIDYNGSIIDENIKQEHVLGSNTYILSKGRSSKVLKLVYKSV